MFFPSGHLQATPPVACLRALCVGAVILLGGGAALAKEETHSFRMRNGTEVRYNVVMPDNYDGTTPLPALLAFAGGDQRRNAIDWALKHYWRDEAERRGYFVISPYKNGLRPFEGGEKYIPEFLQRIMVRYKIKDEQFHVVGVASGGLSALQVAAFAPEYFTSVLAIPGFFLTPSDKKYRALAGKCVIQISGSRQYQWAEGAERDHKRFQELGQNTYLEIVRGSLAQAAPYRFENAGKLFDMIEARVGC